MAITLQALRNLIITSVHGRRLGLDINEALVGVKNVRLQQAAGTSDTTGTNLPNHGFVSVTTTTNDGWVLDRPYTGAKVTLYTGTTSTGSHSIALGSGVVGYSTNGIEGSTVFLMGAGAAMTLLGISTAAWQVISYGSPSTAVNAMTS